MTGLPLEDVSAALLLEAGGGGGGGEVEGGDISRGAGHLLLLPDCDLVVRVGRTGTLSGLYCLAASAILSHCPEERDTNCG